MQLGQNTNLRFAIAETKLNCTRKGKATLIYPAPEFHEWCGSEGSGRVPHDSGPRKRSIEKLNLPNKQDRSTMLERQTSTICILACLSWLDLRSGSITKHIFYL